MNADGAVRHFWQHFGVARGIKPIKHYTQANGWTISKKRIGKAINEIKDLRHPNAQEARLQEDLRQHNDWRFQNRGIRADVLKSGLIPIAGHSDSEWQADLINMRAATLPGNIGWDVPRAQDPKYIFVLIHLASRRVFARPLRSNARQYILPAFNFMLNAIHGAGLSMTKLTTDGGPEFSTWFNRELQNRNIVHDQPPGSPPHNPISGWGNIKPSGAGDKTYVSMVERVNQSIRTILSRLRTENNYQDLSWWRYLDRAIQIYNDTLQTKADDTPANLSGNNAAMQHLLTREKGEKTAQIQNLKARNVLVYNIGEAVRLKRTAHPTAFAGHTEGRITSQQRFIVYGVRGSRYLLMPVNSGAGHVNHLIPPRLYRRAQGIYPFWAPHHLIERVPDTQQPQIEAPTPQQDEAARIETARRMGLLGRRRRTQAYAQLHPEREETAEEIEEIARNPKRAMRSRTRRYEPIATRTRSSKR